MLDLLVKFLEDNHYRYYCTGIYKNGAFSEYPGYFKLNAVKVQIKKEYERNILKIFVPLLLKEIYRSKYEIVYSIGENYYLYLEFVVSSHVIVPELILKDFCSNDTKLYYIDTEKVQIKCGSARKFNTKFGYYSLRFEEYLSDNYETKIGKLKKQVEKFVFKKEPKVQFVGLFNDIKDFLNMSFFRNPRFIEQVNKESLSSKLIYKGYNSESVALFYHQFGTNVMEGMSVYLVENRTSEGFLLSDELFSNIYIKEDVHGMIFPLHPKYGFIIVPNEYYESQNKIYTDESYMVVQDLDTLHRINKRIFDDCKKIGANVIGKKEDLENILSLQ